MQNYLYDLHVHTSEVSSCGHVDGKEVAQLYSKAGYSGIVVTDHYYDNYFANALGSWEEKVQQYLSGYLETKAEGAKHGLAVFLGIEIRFAGSRNDYLVYGISEEFLLVYPQLYELTLPEFSQLVRNQGLVLYQAHPFRGYCTAAKPEYLDGVEVFNGNPRHQSNNHQAEVFAKQHRLSMISGSDFHQYEDLAIGGVYFSEKIRDNNHLVSVLKNNQIVKLKKGSKD